MKRLMISIAVIALLVWFAPSASAEDNFANHLDLFQVAVGKNGQVHILDVGYHFTLLRKGRFQLLGAGIGLDVYENKNSCTNYESVYGLECNTGVSPFVIWHLGSISLARQPGKGEFGSFGANLVYDPKQKYSGISFGFSYGWR